MTMCKGNRKDAKLYKIQIYFLLMISIESIEHELSLLLYDAVASINL